MSEKVVPGPLSCGNGFKEAVCINASRIYDTCKDKDCLEDLRVYFTNRAQDIINRAINIKPRTADIVWVYIDVEEVPFNDGFFTVDIKYFFRVKFDVFCGISRPIEVEGLATFDKRVILFGSEGSAKTFTSEFKPDVADDLPTISNNLPKASVDVVPPIVLGVKVKEQCDRHCGKCCIDVCCIPDCINNLFGGAFVDNDVDKRVLVTLGLFTVVRLERNVPILIPAYDFCIPIKECVSSDEDNPCGLFQDIQFPLDEFFPPESRVVSTNDRDRDRKGICRCFK